MIKLTTEEIRYIGLFEQITKVRAKDCVTDEISNSLVTFVVDEDKMGLAIGREGRNMKILKKIIKKDVNLVAFSEDPLQLAKNALAPAVAEKVEIVEKNGKKVIVVTMDYENRKLAIGKGGRRIRNAKKIVQRHHGIDDIVFR
jgi:N utilization substance protein A